MTDEQCRSHNLIGGGNYSLLICGPRSTWTLRCVEIQKKGYRDFYATFSVVGHITDASCLTVPCLS